MEKQSVLRANQVKNLDHNHFELLYWGQKQFVCGVDEAGRGPLAGPVVAAAVILPQGTQQLFLRDSKVMTEPQRDKAYHWICSNAQYAIGIAQPFMIDSINIRQATEWAMRRAVLQLMATAPVKPAALLIDAMILPLEHHQYLQHGFVYGESKSASIAAASIVAKVTRDRIMRSMNNLFPAYEFATHKGYGTATHKKAIQTYSPSIIHRQTFSGVSSHKKDDDVGSQQTVF